MREPIRKRPCRECPWKARLASTEEAQAALDGCPGDFYCHKDDPQTNGKTLVRCASLYLRPDLRRSP